MSFLTRIISSARIILLSNVCEKGVNEELGYTVGSKIIRAFTVILAINLWFSTVFLLSHACYKQHKA